MAVTVSANIPSILDPAKMEIFLDSAVRRSGMDFFRFVRVREASTRTLEKTSYHGPEGRQTRTEGDDYPFNEVLEAYDKTYTQSEKVFAAQISEFSYRYFDRVAIAEYIQEVGAVYGRSLNADGYGIISGGFSDSGPDGQALFSAAHPSIAGGNRSNLGSTALAYGALQTALSALRRQKTSQSQFANVEPRLLVVSPELEYTARQLVSSPYTSDQFQTNVVGTKGLEVLVNPEITDTNDWFLLDPLVFRAFMYIGKGSQPRQWIDPDSGNWRLADSDHKASGYDGWIGAWGAQVA